MAARRIRGITIEIGGDTTKLVKALSSVDNALNKTQTNLREINKALKLDPTNTNLLKDRQKELADAIADTKSKLKTEKQALEQMKNTEGFDANSRAARDLQTQIDLDTAALKNLEEQARQASSVLGSQMQAAGQKIQEVGNKIKSVGDSIAGLGSKLTATVTTPIVGAFGASAKAAVDWETAFTGVQKTVDASAEGYDQLANNIQKMATETASSANDIAGVMEIAGQLGITGVDGLTTFTKTMVELGDTTNMSAEDAATALARFMNITGESTGDVEKIGSAIVDLGNNFATSESEITQMATRLASAGTIAGMSSTDILALSAAMSSVGIQAEAGGTAMTQTLSAMTAAVADFEAGSTEDLDKIAEVANMNAEEFAKAWNEQPIKAVQSFIAGLGTLDQKGENATLVLDKLGMSGVRQANMLKSLSLASGVLSDAIETSSRAYEENTALSAEAEKRYATMAAKMSQLRERIVQVGVSIGEMLMPYIEKAMDKIEGLVEKWNSLDESQQKNILKFAAIAAAVGPVLLIVGKLISSVGSIVSVVGKVVSGIGLLLSSLGGLSGILGAIVSPIGIVVAAVAALAAGFIYLYNTNENFRNAINTLVEDVKANFETMLATIQPFLDGLREAFSNLITALGPVIENMAQTFQGIMKFLAPVFEFIATAIAGVVNGLMAAAGPMIAAVTNVINIITGIIQAFTALFQGDTTAFFAALQTIFDNSIGLIVNLIQTKIAFIIAFFNTFGVNIVAVFTNLWNNIKTIVTGLAQTITTTFSTGFNVAKSVVSTGISAIKNAFSTLKSSIKGVFDNIINSMKQWGHDMIDNLVSGIKEKISSVGDAISSVADTIRSYIHFSVPDVGPLADFSSYAPDMMKLFADGIRANASLISDAVSSSFNIGPLIQGTASQNALAIAGADSGSLQPIQVNLTLEGDAARLFRIVNIEADRNRQITGQVFNSGF